MQRRAFVRSLSLAAVLAVAAAAPAWATNSCRDEAKLNFKICKANSKEDFQAAKDACLNRDHQCVEVCRAERYDCRLATGFDAAIAQIEADLAAAKEQCRADHPAGSPERDACIDAAQVLAFQRRDQAREDAKPALKQCRVNFRNCALACPPASPQAPVDPAQCLIDAKTAYKAALAQCREDFQIAKDACRNKDHTCVEGCREQREQCLAPVLTQLANDIAACNAQKAQDVADCQSQYGENGSNPDPTLLDQCIDIAQVHAFECRDAAREAARPGFESCRQGFRSCVEACPAAS